jgi:NifU-like protein involved in Fe-S cluster formation
MPDAFTQFVYNEFENNLYNLEKIPIGRVDGVGSNRDTEFGIVVITIQMNPKDTSHIKDLHWSMPMGTRTMAAFCSLLAKYVIGKTIVEAASTTYTDVATAFNVTWPSDMAWHTHPPLQAMRAALNNVKKL